MTHHIFFSWQSDTHNATGRNLVEYCLRKAIKAVQADAELDPVHRRLALDRDTLNTPGTPPIMETIFDKIANSAVFVADMTYVARRDGGGRSPNPNVLIEYGWALRALSWRRIILVMNTAAGHPENYELPFDLRQMRRPFLYRCSARANTDGRKAAREELTRMLTAALKAIFENEAALAEMRPAAPAAPHPHDIELLRKVHKLLSRDARQFFHQHDFGKAFPRKMLEPVYEIADWVGAAFEFHDRELQAQFEKMRTAIAAFAKIALERIHAMDRNPHMASPLTDQDRARGVQPETHAVIKSLNESATALCEAMDAFERLARDRIRIAIADMSQEEAIDPRAEQAAEALGQMAMDGHRGHFPEIVSRPRLTLRLAPFAATEGRRLDPASVKALQVQFSVARDAPVKLDSDARQWWACAPPIRREGVVPNPETTWRMRIARPGILEYQATVGVRIDDDPEIVIDGRKLEAKIVRHMERLGYFAQELGFGGPALASIHLEGMEDVVLMRPGAGGRRIKVRELAFETIHLADISQSIAPALQEIFDIMWQSGGWADGSTSYLSGVWVGYKGTEDYAWMD